MAPLFAVRTSSHFQRLYRHLRKRRSELASRYAQALRVLQEDPYNHSRQHNIRTLEGGTHGEGQYRLRLGRWRFRYDIFEQEVLLYYVGLRREETYR